MTKIKICGITNLKDAFSCAEAGADVLGFVFAVGGRQVSLSVAEKICKKLPDSVSKAGVFVNENLITLNRIAGVCHLDYVQLHGNEDRAYLKQLKIPFLKVFQVQNEAILAEIKNFRLSFFMLDTFIDGRSGGTGKTFNWDIALQAKKLGRVFLSGGLTAENVRGVLEKVNPYGVDVCSGVEKSPGKKGLVKVTKFIQEVRRWDSRIN
ncbi:MAG: hypothetical protein A2142_08770 [candidate division Zixibacteria bacterium RBG_16_48_11]|nr:MAG: hypothetical protein A2142_08770 [candidate division Zixibacteria bacterium RBG_16_48_11]